MPTTTELARTFTEKWAPDVNTIAEGGANLDAARAEFAWDLAVLRNAEFTSARRELANKMLGFMIEALAKETSTPAAIEAEAVRASGPFSQMQPDDIRRLAGEHVKRFECSLCGNVSDSPEAAAAHKCMNPKNFETDEDRPAREPATNIGRQTATEAPTPADYGGVDAVEAPRP